MYGNLHQDLIMNIEIKLELSTKNLLPGQLKQVFRAVNTNGHKAAFHFNLSFMLILFF